MLTIRVHMVGEARARNVKLVNCRNSDLLIQRVYQKGGKVISVAFYFTDSTFVLLDPIPEDIINEGSPYKSK